MARAELRLTGVWFEREDSGERGTRLRGSSRAQCRPDSYHHPTRRCLDTGSAPCPQPGQRPTSRKSSLQISGKEEFLTDRLMRPMASTDHRWPVRCECQARFRGRLPVPRAEAALPYWVPLSLRPRRQVQKTVRCHISKTTKVCPCPCHRFGGHLPMPRGQAAMPYWVPLVLRSPRKAVKRQQSFKGIQDRLDQRSRYNRWRVCGAGLRLSKWRQLQALHQQEPPAPGWGASPPAPSPPLSLSLRSFVQAILRVIGHPASGLLAPLLTRGRRAAGVRAGEALPAVQ